jgi:glyoxylase-like metal-dependent hydrolase (beta-lactamase superfamily II)
MNYFEKEIDYIYRLKVPYEAIYTSVFLIEYEDGYILFDAATTEYDVNTYILPALKEMGISLEAIKYIVISHNHEDHAWGLETIKKHIKHIEVINTIRDINNNLSTYPLPGHTLDLIGLLDLRTNTLIAADGVQGHGVGIYTPTMEDANIYLETLDKLRKDERIQNIIFSHLYEPWFKNKAIGKEEIEMCLFDSEQFIRKKGV